VKKKKTLQVAQTQYFRGFEALVEIVENVEFHKKTS